MTTPTHRDTEQAPQRISGTFGSFYHYLKTVENGNKRVQVFKHERYNFWLCRLFKGEKLLSEKKHPSEGGAELWSERKLGL